MKRFQKYSGYIAAFVFCVAVIAVYKTFDNFSNITKYIGKIFRALGPFIGAFIVAYILNMPAKRVKKLLEKSKNGFIKKRAHGISILIVYLAAVLVVAFILWMLVPALIRNLIDLVQNAGTYANAVTKYIRESRIARMINLDAVDISKTVESFIGGLDMTKLQTYAQGVMNMTSGFMNTFVAIIASIYMLIDKERLQRLFTRLLSSFVKKKTVMSVAEHARRINEVFTNYIYSRLACSIIMAIICSIVLSLMNVRYALILGIFIGAMDMIPYFGSIISSVIAVIIALITSGDFWHGFWVAVVLLGLQQFDGNILGPKVMGESMELRPFWIIFSISVGGSLFGFGGMLISVPVFAIIKLIVSDYVATRENRLAAETDSGGDEKVNEQDG